MSSDLDKAEEMIAAANEKLINLPKSIDEIDNLRDLAASVESAIIMMLEGYAQYGLHQHGDEPFRPN